MDPAMCECVWLMIVCRLGEVNVCVVSGAGGKMEMYSALIICITDYYF